MLSKGNIAAVAGIGVPIANEATGNGIITAFDLENYIWLGMTYGAWFKILALFSLLLIVGLNAKKFLIEVVIPSVRCIKKWFGKGKGD